MTSPTVDNVRAALQAAAKRAEAVRTAAVAAAEAIRAERDATDPSGGSTGTVGQA